MALIPPICQIGKHRVASGLEKSSVWLGERFLWVLMLTLTACLPLTAKNENQLLQAVNARQTEAAQKALDKGADPNAVDKNTGLPILAMAARNCDGPMLRLLLGRVQATPGSLNAALSAAGKCTSCGDEGALPVLLQVSRTPYMRAKGSYCWTTWRTELGPKLIDLVRHGDLEGTRALAANAAPLDYQERIRIRAESKSEFNSPNAAISAWSAAEYSDEGPTALYYAVKTRNARLVRLLVEAGANTRITFHELDSGSTKTTLAQVCDALNYGDIKGLLTATCPGCAAAPALTARKPETIQQAWASVPVRSYKTDSVQLALWIGHDKEVDMAGFLQNLATAARVPSCRMEVGAVASSERNTLREFSSSAKTGQVRFFQGREALKDRSIDAMLFLGFMDGTPDVELDGLLSEDKPPALGSAIVAAASEGKDIYILAGASPWEPDRKFVKDRSVVSRYHRVTWLGDGSTYDLSEFCRSIQSRGFGPGTVRFDEAISSLK